MTILFGTTSLVLQCNGKNYNDAILAQFKRFEPFCNKFLCACHCKTVDAPTQALLESDKIEYIFLPKVNSISSLIHKKKEYEVLYDAVKKADFCIVLISTTAGNEIFKIARKIGKPCLCIQIGSSRDALWNHSLKGKLVMPFYYLNQKKIARQATHTIYVSERFLQEHYPTKGKWIPCSNVELHDVDSDVLRRRIESIRALKSTKELTIVTCGAVDVKYKGHADVIKAMAMLKSKGFNLRYVMVGGGSQDRLKSLVRDYKLEDNVSFAGQMPHDEVFAMLDSADLYIQPSHTEGLPRALVEAMSRACPCLGTNVGGIPELIQDEYIFGKGDVRKIARMIESLTIDNMLKMAETNFTKAQEYQVDILNKRRHDFVKEFLHDFKLD